MSLGDLARRVAIIHSLYDLRTNEADSGGAGMVRALETLQIQNVKRCGVALVAGVAPIGGLRSALRQPGRETRWFDC